jgi:hypothetical protein
MLKEDEPNQEDIEQFNTLMRTGSATLGILGDFSKLRPGKPRDPDR